MEYYFKSPEKSFNNSFIILSLSGAAAAVHYDFNVKGCE